MNLEPKVWGPHFWFVIHTMALTYPNRPNDIIKKKQYDFIKNLPSFLPNKTASSNFIGLLDLYPVAPYLDSRKSFIEWTHFIHNKINEMLDKPKIKIDEFYANYYKEYKPIETKLREYSKFKEKLIYFGVIGLIITIICYGYTL